MKQEDKELLLKDLSARLPYGVKIDKALYGETTLNERDIESFRKGFDDTLIPYLRQMSSMTEEEKRELQSFFPGSFGNQWFNIEEETIEIFECPSTMTLYLNDSKRVIDFFNSHHIDYRGLIVDGLSLEAPEGMYKEE